MLIDARRRVIFFGWVISSFMNLLSGLEINEARPHDKLPYRGAWLWVGSEMIHLMELPSPDPLTGRPEHGGRDRHTCIAIKDVAKLKTILDDAGKHSILWPTNIYRCKHDFNFFGKHHWLLLSCFRYSIYTKQIRETGNLHTRSGCERSRVCAVGLTSDWEKYLYDHHSIDLYIIVLSPTCYGSEVYLVGIPLCELTHWVKSFNGGQEYIFLNLNKP